MQFIMFQYFDRSDYVHSACDACYSLWCANYIDRSSTTGRLKADTRFLPENSSSDHEGKNLSRNYYEDARKPTSSDTK